MDFSQFNLHPALSQALAGKGYTRPTPIQIESIPVILEGHDLLGCAQTGTGKTAAFALPTLQRMQQAAQDEAKSGGSSGRARTRPVRTLVLVPTRELATQVCQSYQAYGAHTGLRAFAVFGGVSIRPQVAALRKGIDILIATPGRLLDLTRQHAVKLNQVSTLILDEADQMLDMGFIEDLKRIVSYVPQDRQTLMFSATMPMSIRQLASQWLRNPREIAVKRESATPSRIEQAVCFVEQRHKPHFLEKVLRDQGRARTLVFCRTKHGADKVVRHLEKCGIAAIAIHGNKTQNARQNALRAFKAGTHTILVATDIASRGLHIDAIDTVVNYELPETAEIYVHRIGRTARAEASGKSLTLCAPEERHKLRQVERLTRKALNEVKIDVDVNRLPAPAPASNPVQASAEPRPRFHSSKPAGFVPPRAGKRPFRPGASGRGKFPKKPGQPKRRREFAQPTSP